MAVSAFGVIMQAYRTEEYTAICNLSRPILTSDIKLLGSSFFGFCATFSQAFTVIRWRNHVTQYKADWPQWIHCTEKDGNWYFLPITVSVRKTPALPFPPQTADMIWLNRQLLRGLVHVKVHLNGYNSTGLYPYPLPASVQNAQNTQSLIFVYYFVNINILFHFRELLCYIFAVYDWTRERLPAHTTLERILSGFYLCP